VTTAEPPLAPESLLEALLFAAPQAVTPESLAEVIGWPAERVMATLAQLEARLWERGVRLQRQRGHVQLVSAPQAAPYIEKLWGLDVHLRLSQAALETLSIVAYTQPITRPQIEAVRGVSSGGVLRTLLLAGLIEEQGRAESVGRPILYGTTETFLQQFGLTSLGELPPLEQADKANVIVK
jgi:segregation and condensation protein B